MNDKIHKTFDSFWKDYYNHRLDNIWDSVLYMDHDQEDFAEELKDLARAAWDARGELADYTWQRDPREL